MNRASRFALLPLLFCLTAALPAWGRKDKSVSLPEERSSMAQEEQKPVEQSAVVQAFGRVRLVGSSMFANLVITGEDKEWYIDKDDEHLFKDLQHRTVTVEGLETVQQLTFASGVPAGERRTLKYIKIIAIE
jgi:hypothetical protein